MMPAQRRDQALTRFGRWRLPILQKRPVETGHDLLHVAHFHLELRCDVGGGDLRLVQVEDPLLADRGAVAVDANDANQ